MAHSGRSHVAITALFLFASTVSGPRPAAQEARTDTQGIKETEKFIEQGAEVAHAVGVARLQVESALTAYNTLVSTPSKNMKRDYGKLLKELKTMDDKANEARTQISEMDDASKTYFAGRATTIGAIEDPELKKQAETRLADSQKQYSEVLAALRSAGESLDPVRKDLNDQIKFLGSDLNPSAAASLAPNAQKLNERAKATFAQADEAIRTANTYFNSMRPQH